MGCRKNPAWEVPFDVRKLSDAFHDVISKIEARQWLKFARTALKLNDNTIDSIKRTEGDRTIKKYRMCEAWAKKYGEYATITKLYNILNHFLYPEEVPREHSGNRSRSSQMHTDLSQTDCNYCNRVGRVAITHPTSDTAKSEMLLGYNRWKKGVVLIINNNFVESRIFSQRKGSKVDVANMTELWEKLGCHVIKEEDKGVDDMIKLLKMVRELSREHDYIVVIVMSHGDADDVIYGANGRKLPTRHITEIFNYENAPQMGEKPRLFFFQCSRGRKLSKNSSTESSPGDHFSRGLTHSRSFSSSRSSGYLDPRNYDEDREESDPLAMSNDGSHNERLDMAHQVVRDLSQLLIDKEDDPPLSNTVEGPWEDVPMKPVLPPLSDMLICYSTAPGYSAFRDPKNGSWYINAITNVFKVHAKTEHVLDLMVKVNQAVAARSMKRGECGAMGACCTPHFECTLRKKLYLA